jgi:hypothetical protein
VAAAGPWAPVDARARRPGPAAKAMPGVSPAGDPGVRCVVPVAAEDAMALPAALVVSLEAAGALEPGEDVALRAGGRQVAVAGLATGLPRRRRRRFMPPAGT